MAAVALRGQENIDLIRSLGRVTGQPAGQAAPVDPVALAEVAVRALDLCNRLDRFLIQARTLRDDCAPHTDCALSCASEKKSGVNACPNVRFMSRLRPPRKLFEPDAIAALTSFVPLFFSARSNCARGVCARPFGPITPCASAPRFFS